MKADKLKYRLFQELCQTYNKDLQKFIFNLARKDNFAMEEIFQNTMVQALHGLNSLKENEKMKSWLFSIAKTEAKRYYSKNSIPLSSSIFLHFLRPLKRIVLTVLLFICSISEISLRVMS